MTVLASFRNGATSRADAALLAAGFEKKFDPNQARDEHGRWSSGGGSGGGVPKLKGSLHSVGYDIAGAVAHRQRLQAKNTEDEATLLIEADNLKGMARDDPEYDDLHADVAELKAKIGNRQKDIDNINNKIKLGGINPNAGKPTISSNQNQDNFGSAQQAQVQRDIKQDTKGSFEDRVNAATAAPGSVRGSDGIWRSPEQLRNRNQGFLSNIKEDVKDLHARVIRAAGEGSEWHRGEDRPKSESDFLRNTANRNASHDWTAQLGNTAAAIGATVLRATRAANEVSLIARNIGDIADNPNWINIGVRLNDITAETRRLRTELKAIPPTAKFAWANADHQIAVTERTVREIRAAVGENTAEGRVKAKTLALKLQAATRRMASLPGRIARSVSTRVSNFPGRVRTWNQERVQRNAQLKQEAAARRMREWEEAARRAGVST